MTDVTALWQYLDSRTRPPLTPSQTVVPGLEQRLEVFTSTAMYSLIGGLI